mmetsp:Transcript_19441/g.29886  ORF Transcript_19441/g.29886 Transcript_19441/m.29886 type:complete len:134 (-) Transcript_19441:19-420(-)
MGSPPRARKYTQEINEASPSRQERLSLALKEQERIPQSSVNSLLKLWLSSLETANAFVKSLTSSITLKSLGGAKESLADSRSMVELLKRDWVKSVHGISGFVLPQESKKAALSPEERSQLGLVQKGVKALMKL